jgi:hypothetical protein
MLFIQFRQNKNMRKHFSAVVFIAVLALTFFLTRNVGQAQTTATLDLSPASTSVAVNQTFTVAINMNTAGAPADGVDVFKIHFVPGVLQVVDSDGVAAGVQIAPGSLLPNTAINSVDNVAGTISFSQSTTGGSSFTGSGAIGTITFRGVAAGTSAVTFDFTPGSTADTNVAYQGVDRLSSVTNASFTVTLPDTTAPTVSMTAPPAGNVSGAVTVSATASDNVGVAGVQFKLDGVNLGAEDTTAPYSISWNTATASVGTHTLTATARDAAANTTTSAGVSVTIPAAFDFALSNGGAKTVTQGSNVTNTITATLSSGTTTAATFSASGLPTGVTAAFAPTSCSPTCTSTLTLTATAGATVGTTTTTITAVAGGVTHTTTFNLTVSSGFDFTLSNGGAKSVTQGSNVTNTITATLSSGTTQAVTFSASGLPTGVTAAFAPTSCSPTCTSTLTLTATAGATVGTTTTTVTGTAGSISHTTTFSLTVVGGTFQRTIQFDTEGRANRTLTGALDALNNATKALIKSYSFTSNAAGTATVTFDISPQTVYLKIKAAPFLTRLLPSIDLNTNTTYTFAQLLTGDINQDNIINSVDYSVMNTNWFTSNTSADLNQDGLVNSIDYSYMNKHWLVTGEQ